MENLLEVKSLTKKYGSFVALDNVSINIEGGKIIGLLGPNGSGKTTFLKCVAGLLTIDGGSISVCGYPVGEETKKRVSFLPERTYMDNSSTIDDAVDLFCEFYEDFDREKAYAMLKSLNVDPTKKFRALSKGTKEKVQLILVMSRRAKLFLLDEPIGGVDPAAREFILNTILVKYKEGATIIVSTHLIRDVEEILDEYIMVNDNKFVAYGSVKDLHEKGLTLDEVFREEFRCF